MGKIEVIVKCLCVDHRDLSKNKDHFIYRYINGQHEEILQQINNVAHLYFLMLIRSITGYDLKFYTTQEESLGPCAVWLHRYNFDNIDKDIWNLIKNIDLEINSTRRSLPENSDKAFINIRRLMSDHRYISKRKDVIDLLLKISEMTDNERMARRINKLVNKYVVDLV